MTDRRPLGTGPVRADVSRTRDTDPVPAPRAQLAAERLPAVPASAEPEPAHPLAGARGRPRRTRAVTAAVAPGL
ncbi:hypothetical protein ABZ672_57205 [Streptomyces mirabilis]|uniref:hypothetical protein n=1 Tax=Streptomyces mirabilis TaxID=68239 RepID=UPI0033C5C888